MTAVEMNFLSPSLVRIKKLSIFVSDRRLRFSLTLPSQFGRVGENLIWPWSEANRSLTVREKASAFRNWSRGRVFISGTKMKFAHDQTNDFIYFLSIV